MFKSPARKITPDPSVNCYNPDASGPVCMACRYPRFILDLAARYPGDRLHPLPAWTWITWIMSTATAAGRRGRGSWLRMW